MARFYILDIPENDEIIQVASQNPDHKIDHVGPYWRITASDPVTIDRRATGCRHAVWYSAVAGLEDSMIAQQDKEVLRVDARWPSP